MRVFITAVAGTGMGSLAGLLVELGHDVAGSDTAFLPPMGPALAEWGVRLFQGFDGAHLEGMAHHGQLPELVVVGNVCRKDNPEAVRALELCIERVHIGDALKRFALTGTSPLVVAGTHGKTTTSSLCAHLLTRTGFEPGYLIGGIPCASGRGFRSAGKRTLAKTGTHAGMRRTPFVLEGDEYDSAFWEKTAKFLHYGAEVAIVTSVEHDHIDIYPTFESYADAFRKLIAGLPAQGLLVAFAGDATVVDLAKDAPCEVVYYALENDDCGKVAPHYYALVAERTEQGTTFDLFVGGVLAGRYLCPLPGDYNLRNALAALAVCAHGYGAPLRALMEPLARFEGVKRRQELLGTPGGVFVFDDFAHHPTAVRETLQGMRCSRPKGKLLAVFEPRSATACSTLHQEAYTSAFDAASHVLLAPVGRSLPKTERLDVTRLVREMNAGRAGTDPTNPPFAEHLSTVEALAHRACSLATPGDSIVVLSNGSFGGIHAKLLEALSTSKVLEALTASTQSSGDYS